MRLARGARRARPRPGDGAEREAGAGAVGGRGRSPAAYRAGDGHRDPPGVAPRATRPRRWPCCRGPRSTPRRRRRSTTRCVRSSASRCSAAAAAASPTRPRRACRCAAWVRAARAAPWCSSTDCRSTTRSAAGCTGRASRGSRLERIEVLRGGASDLYGSSALGGVVQAHHPARPRGAGRRWTASCPPEASQRYDGSLSAGGLRGDWWRAFSAQAFSHRRLRPGRAADRGRGGHRGRVAATSAGDATARAARFGDGRVFARGFRLRRGPRERDAAPVRTTRACSASARSGSTGAGRTAAGRGAPLGRVAALPPVVQRGRRPTARARTSRGTQRVPADALGAVAAVVAAARRAAPRAGGLEAQQVDGTTQETAFARGVADEPRRGGRRARGRPRSSSRTCFQAHPRLLLLGSARLDGWWHRDGHS